jgi:hypothetical protein
MERQILINFLQLACSPICNFEFALLKDEAAIQRLLKQSNIYIIAQRPELTFENVTFDIYRPFLNFEIHQRAKPRYLKSNFAFIARKYCKRNGRF